MADHDLNEESFVVEDHDDYTIEDDAEYDEDYPDSYSDEYPTDVNGMYWSSSGTPFDMSDPDEAIDAILSDL